MLGARAVCTLLCVCFSVVCCYNINDVNDLINHVNQLDFTKYRDCNEARRAGYTKSGLYRIHLLNSTRSVTLNCEHGPTNSATVIQRRYYGNVPFQQNWLNYKMGFGHPSGDFWLGLDHISALTTAGNSQLTIQMQDATGATQTMIYKYFHVQPEAYNYRLSIANAFGFLPDDMSHQNNMPFATWDRPDPNGCATHMRVGWWYNYCAYTLLNGHYYPPGKYHPSGQYFDGIYWKDWQGFDYSLKFVSMTVSPPQ